MNPPPVAGSIFFDLNVIVGNFSTSKKSALRRWSSRFGSRVFTEATSIVAEIFAEPGSAGLPSMLAVNLSKVPFTFDTIMWRTAKPTVEWELSTVQVSASAGRLAVPRAAARARDNRFFFIGSSWVFLRGGPRLLAVSPVRVRDVRSDPSR